ncbi:MAG: SIS domain-containing protein [Burkholderiales bacterium]
MKDYTKRIMDYLNLEIETIKRLDIGVINILVNKLHDAFQNERNIYICGNGGSAATASHFANDFNKGISEYTEKKFHFICLNDNLPTLTAIANDIGYDYIYEFQLKGRIKKDDLLLCISGSGNSKNIICAAKYAKSVGAIIVGITGYDGGLLSKISDISLNVPINDMQITEDIHMIFDHLIMSVFLKSLENEVE